MPGEIATGLRRHVSAVRLIAMGRTDPAGRTLPAVCAGPGATSRPVADAPIAVVTGANRGIGYEVVRQLAARGHLVVLTARDPARGAAAAARLDPSRPGGLDVPASADRRHGGSCTGVRVVPGELDVSHDGSAERLAARLAERFGRVDVLVNNAAIMYDTWASARSADLAAVRTAMQTNLFGAWRVTQALLPLLLRSAHPRIVNVSSGAGSITEMTGGTPAYSVSKAALNALTRLLADELRGDRVLVNAVCPGWVATDMGGGGRPVPEGAAGVVWAATLPDGGPTGGFFRDGRPIAW